MNPNNTTFLTDEQYFGNQQVEELKKYRTKAAITDFAILLGGYVSDNYHTIDGNNLEDRTGYHWTSSSVGDGDVRVVDNDGARDWNASWHRGLAARPASPYSDISLISPNVVRGVFRRPQKQAEVEYGEYPQQAVNSSLQTKLENEYQAQRLNVTGRKFTTDSRQYDNYREEFEPQQHQEVEHGGKRYVRIIANMYSNPTTLSNGVEVKNGDAVWVEGQPLKRIVLEKSKQLLCKKLVYAGVPFNTERIGDYEASAIKIFNELRFAVECTEHQIAPKEYVLGEKYKRVPANAFKGINGLEKVTLESQIQEIGEGAFEGFGFVSKGQDGKLVVSKDRIQNALWEFSIGDRTLIHIATDSSSKPIIYVKNKYGNVDLVTENGEKINICDVNAFKELQKQHIAVHQRERPVPGH